MKKILIIGYGGTIVMVIDKERKSVVPAENINDILALLPSLSEVADIEFEVLSNLDSTNVTPADWTKLAYFLAEKRDLYDGFVITHGTNTMAYTASALTLALGMNFNKPIVLTGSQLPLTVYGNDARFNFENAVKTAVVAAEHNINEVMIVFSDVILRGARSMKISESNFRAFASPNFPNIGDIQSTGIHFNQYARHTTEHGVFQLSPHFESSVLTIDLVPGILPSLVDEVLKSGRCKGLLLKSHGAGSVPTISEYSFLPLIKKTVELYKIPVLVVTKFVGGNAFKEVNDEPAIQALESGGISARDMTDVMAQVKLMWLLGQQHTSREDIQKNINTSFVGEVTV